MDIRSILTKLNELSEATNPYSTAADRAKFDAMTPQDQSWLTASGGVPDINDEFILNRAPNKGQPDPTKASQQTQQPDITQKVEQLKALLTKAEQQKSAPAATATPAATTGQGAQSAAKPAAGGLGQVTQNANGTFSAQKKDGTSITFDKDGKVLSESSLAKNLVESFGYEINEADTSALQYGGAAGAGLTKMGLAKAGAKTAAKLAPGVGTTLSAIDAWNRFKEGDHTGAVIAALAGAGWLIPGPAGWIIGGGLDAANIARDLSKEEPQQAAQPAAGAKADPKIVALQKYLVSQGAKNPDGTPLKVDGIMGKNTRAAMDAANLNEAQQMELLRLQLESINLDEASLAGDIFKQSIKSAGAGAKNIGQNIARGLKGQTYQNITGAAKGLKGSAATQFQKAVPGAKTAHKVASVVGKNPKLATAIGAGTVAGAAGYAAGQQGATPQGAQPAGKKGATSQGAQPAAPATATTGQIDPELLKQIAALTAEIKAANSQDPAVLAIISHAEQVVSGK